MPAQPPKLLDQACTEPCRSVSAALRARHYPTHAEEACLAWIKRFILFHGKRHPSTLAAPEVMTFLNSLAAAERLAARTALLFLYRQVLNRPLDLPARAHTRRQRDNGRLTCARATWSLRIFSGSA